MEFELLINFIDKNILEKIKKIKEFIEQGFNINEKNNKGNTTLDIALKYGYSEIVKYFESLKSNEKLSCPHCHKKLELNFK